MGPRGAELSSELKAQIIQYYKDKKSVRVIARLVHKCPATVQKVIERYRDSGSIRNKARSGRPRKFDEAEHHLILQKVQQNAKMSALKLQEEVECETGKLCNTETIRRVLYSAGYIGPLIHRKRVEFAKLHLQHDLNYWRKVIFSSECQFQAYQSAQHVTQWRRVSTESDATNPLFASKQSDNLITLWGCMSAKGVGRLVICDTQMNREKYLKILQENVIASASKLDLPSGGYIFQQDNDCKYRTGVVRDWLLYKVGKVLYTPSQSNDLNPLEQIWGHLDFMLQQSAVQSEKQLRTLLENEWQQITSQVTEALVSSMPQRLQAILDSDQPNTTNI